LKNPTLQLTENIQVPQFGFGTYGLRDGTKAILHALKSGYRHLDTADNYGSHENCAEAIEQSGINRSEIFITTKLDGSTVSKDKVGPAIDRFLKELNTDFVDLVLIHWPSRSVPTEETLTAMEAARQAGKVRAIGVSNFSVAQMKEALATGFPVSNNQIPYNLQERPDDIVEFCFANKVTVTAYSPVKAKGNAKTAKLVNELAKKYSCTNEEVMLAWLMAKGMIVIPRSSNPSHIETNFRSIELELTDDELRALDQQD
jgi:2,5-diketo-D-gluconate reductase B